MQRKTGTLTLQSDKEEVTVTFENGMVVMADSSAKRLEDRLGHVLVKQNKLSAARLEEALQTQKATLQRLGHILVTSNAITAKDLREALQVQVSQIVFKVFRWRDGEYLFAPTDSVDYDRDNFAPMSADFILMEGIRMVDEWPIIEKKIPSMDLVFRPVVDSALIEVVEADGDEPTFGSLTDAKRPSASSKIRLTRQEENIFRKVDGTRTVQGIIDSTGLPEFETCRTLFDLLTRNLISTAGRGAAKTTEFGSLEEPAAPGTPVWGAVAAVCVLALVAMLVRWRTPFAVTGLDPMLRRSQQMLLDDVSHTRLLRLDRAVQAHLLIHGAPPRTLADVAKSGLVDPGYLEDASSRPFHYALTQDGYLLSAVDDAGRPDRTTLIERAVAPERP
ncbi:MAG TPA: DUF4388 domain-containing protein [Vicinamibacteria bacterium]|nr:DUF4388 domain-containing protein [Vicinamibacteria bacterium]